MAFGRPINIQARGSRTVLAALVINSPNIVASERLAEKVWGGSSPATWRQQIHAYVSQLRNTLLGNGVVPDLIKTLHPGYALDSTFTKIDADEFINHIQVARNAARKGDLDIAIEEYALALKLWRGKPLNDLPSYWNDGRIAALEEECLAALVDSGGIKLELGRHVEMIAGLRMAVADYPHSEALHAQLMLALYRSGRPADALFVYRQLRQNLVTDIGVEPTEHVSRLQAAILRGEKDVLAVG